MKIHASKVELVKVADLKPFADNARKHPEKQIDMLAEVIKSSGFTQPILIDDANEVVAGHGRLLAATKLAMDVVPCVRLSGVSKAAVRALRLSDNKLAEMAKWDNLKLKLEMEALKLADFDLRLTGFDGRDLRKLIGGNDAEDDVPPLPAEVITRPGDVWKLGAHRLICGSSTDAATVEKLLDGAKPHLMVTDPPYGVEYDPKWRSAKGVGLNKRETAAIGEVLNDDNADWTPAWQLFPGDVAYVWHAGLHAHTVANSLIAAGFQLRSQIMWNKSSAAIGRSDYHWKHEPCFYAVRKGKPGHWAADRKQTTVWDIAKPSKSESGHSTQKPVDCMRLPILNNSEPGDAVYEPFSGSGTTLIACESEGRICYAIELNPAYVDVAVKRWENLTKKKAILCRPSGDADVPTKSVTKRSRRK